MLFLTQNLLDNNKYQDSIHLNFLFESNSPKLFNHKKECHLFLYFFDEVRCKKKKNANFKAKNIYLFLNNLKLIT